MAQTRAIDLIRPTAFAQIVAREFPNKIRFAPLAVVDTTLEGNPGDTITRPEWSQLTDATELAETDVIVPERLTQSSDTVTIKEAGKGVEFTDKALLTAIGDPVAEGRRQVIATVANKIDADLYATANAGATAVVNPEGTFGVAAMAKAFGRYPEMDEPSDVFAGMVLSNASYMDLLTSELLLTRDKAGPDATLFRGSVGSFMGVPIIVSNRVTSTGDLLIPRGSIALGYKRRPLLETDRDILARSTVVTVNVHYGTWLTKFASITKITTTRS